MSETEAKKADDEAEIEKLSTKIDQMSTARATMGVVVHREPRPSLAWGYPTIPI